MRAWGIRALVAALLLIFFVQSLLAMRQFSVSSDETYHLPAGYTYLKTGDFRLNREHPPLIKELAALPLLWIEPKLDLADPHWLADPPRQVPFGVRFIHGNDADRLLFWGRLPVLLLTTLLGLYVFRWAADLFGDSAGLGALFLFAFSPNLLAHSHFVTMDAGLSTFMLMSSYHLWRWVRQGARLHLIAGGLALGAALATKFSALGLLAALPLCLGLCAWRGIERSDGPMGSERRMRRLQGALGGLAVLLTIAALFVWAVYFFPTDPLFYVNGATTVNANHDPDYPAFMLGQFKPGGWWYYPLVAFALKTPLITLVLLGLSLFGWFRHDGGPDHGDLFVLLPGAVLTVLTCLFADNAGVRYLLPVYPALFVFVSRWVPRLILGPRLLTALVTIGALYYAADTLRLQPDHLAYFNALVGGPKNGHRYLDDSNVEWGQDLKRLRVYMDEHDIPWVHFLYRWNGDPNYYGIRWRPIGPRNWRVQPGKGVYAISTQWLIRGRLSHLQTGDHTDWLERYEPVGRVGHGFYIFEFE